MCSKFLLTLLLLASASIDAAYARTPESQYEAEPVLDAATLAPPALLSGPNYHVDPKVAIGGYMARFRITTPYGPLNADSVQLLSIRIAELPAIETLDRASRSGAFAHALAERGKKTGNAIVNVVTHPIDSIVGLPMGVVRYFKKQVDTWTGRAQSASDRTGRTLENKGDPYRAPPGPMTAARGVERGHSTVSVGDAARVEDTETEVTMDGTVPIADSTTNASPTVAETTEPIAPADEQRKNRAWYARAGSEADREAKRYLKYNQARNEIAKYLGIDPNTSNPYVVERLESLAWAATWGNFSAGEALGAIAGPAADVITDTGLVNQYVLTHTPEQIRDRNEKNLTSVCSDEYDIRVFSRRGGFNDTLRTRFVDSLIKLKPAEGCNDLLELAATTRGEVEARYLVDALALIQRHAPQPGGKLLIAGAALAWLTPDGKLVLPMPVDHLSWTEDIDAFFNRREFVNREKLVLIGGDASALTLLRLGERGWQVVLHAPYEGAPIYAAMGDH